MIWQPRVMSGDIFVVPGWNSVGCFLWADATDATKHLLMHRRAPTTKNHPTQNVSNAEGLTTRKPSHNQCASGAGLSTRF